MWKNIISGVFALTLEAYMNAMEWIWLGEE